MQSDDHARTVLGYLTLERTRALLSNHHARALAVFIGALYAILAMLVGQMLVLARNDGPHYLLILWGSGNGSAPWNYPAVLVSAGWGSLALPFFPTLVMGLMSVGVGLGMAVSVLLVGRLLRDRRASAGRPTLLSSLGGLTPAMIALVTLGACCSTTAAATAGLGVIAQASGTSIDQLLANNWYVGVFQLAVLWVALVAQEQLLAIYRVLFTPRDAAGAERASDVRGEGYWIRGAARASLLVAGLVGLLGVVAEATRTIPVSGPPAIWILGPLPIGFLSVFGILVALFPRELAVGVLTGGSRRTIRVVRSAVFAAGVSLLIWYPSPVVGWGVQGLGNALLGLGGAPVGWGSVAAGDLGLALRWVGLDAVLGGLAVTWAWDPGLFAPSIAPGPARHLPEGSGNTTERVVGEQIGPRTPASAVARASVAEVVHDVAEGRLGLVAPSSDGER